MRLRKTLRKVHRWVGLLAALWLLQLATTGILLQHADDLKLTETYVNSPWILKWHNYGQRLHAWEVGGDVLYQIDDVIRVNDIQMSQTDLLVGVEKWQDQWLIATQNSIRWINHNGEVVQRMDDFDGLPTPISQLSFSHEQPIILVDGQWHVMNESGLFETSDSSVDPVNKSRVISAEEQKQLFPEVLDQKLSYDKALHGIHAGIKGSKWLNTLSAMALLYLCLSGIYLFFKKPKRKSS